MNHLLLEKTRETCLKSDLEQKGKASERTKNNFRKQNLEQYKNSPIPNAF